MQQLSVNADGLPINVCLSNLDRPIKTKTVDKNHMGKIGVVAECVTIGGYANKHVEIAISRSCVMIAFQ
jgi:hypothetical protein